MIYRMTPHADLIAEGGFLWSELFKVGFICKLVAIGFRFPPLAHIGNILSLRYLVRHIEIYGTLSYCVACGDQVFTFLNGCFM